MNKQDLINFRENAMEIRNELKNNPAIRTPEERIALLEKIKEKIGI
jgi:dihydroorotase-like cyclic amidohydrolase